MSQEPLFIEPLTLWMNGSGLESDIVLSSRVRLARNLSEIPFPNRADLNQLAKVKNKVQSLLPELEEATGKRFSQVDIDALNSLERNVLIEKHLISHNHIAKPENRSLVISEDTKISIMVNEEDHLRIQCMVAGLELDKTLYMANRIDDVFEATLDIAFDEEMGYLTSCPTNLGTGLRASVMMHLPGLVFTRQINKIINVSTQLGLAVRGLYGEGSEVSGNIFQISNQLTLGFSEQEIIDNLTSAVLEIITHERAARQALYAQSADILENKVWRSYGILKYARAISSTESLELLSAVRMGIDLKVIDEVPAVCFNELLVASRPNYLQNLKDNNNLSQIEIDKERATLIRESLGRKA